MIRSDKILSTVSMLQKENLDVRTVTIGIDLLDCRSDDVARTCQRIEAKILRYAEKLVPTCDAIGQKYAIQVVNKRLAFTPVLTRSGPHSDGWCPWPGRWTYRRRVGIDFVGGFSTNAENGLSRADEELIAAIPQALSGTAKVCGSVNVGSTKSGINMDAVVLVAHAIKGLAEISAAQGGFAAAKFVAFTNQPNDNPSWPGPFTASASQRWSSTWVSAAPASLPALWNVAWPRPKPTAKA
jgi:uncharacterized protein (UPF0210 family)